MKLAYRYTTMALRKLFVDEKERYIEIGVKIRCLTPSESDMERIAKKTSVNVNKAELAQMAEQSPPKR